eukprot:TRINITY_DN3407_c0_g1_i1.p1 TRINITY_DN3407_c0_g1~~TRINITY_DN3407_c0_g1_i1.p1  ORF type:complete len:227 (-),score=47.54 TRINITY_DN3407_c0_g1_i1:63-743(-)
MSEGKGTVLVLGYQSKAWPAAIKQLIASGYNVKASVASTHLEAAKALNQTPNLEFVSDAEYGTNLKDNDYVILTPGIGVLGLEKVAHYLNQENNPAKVVAIENLQGRNEGSRFFHNGAMRHLKLHYHTHVCARAIKREANTTPITSDLTLERPTVLSTSNHDLAGISSADFGRVVAEALQNANTRLRRFYVGTSWPGFTSRCTEATTNPTELLDNLSQPGSHEARS